MRRRKQDDTPKCSETFLLLPFDNIDKRFLTDNFFKTFNRYYVSIVSGEDFLEQIHEANRCFEEYQSESLHRGWYRSIVLAMAMAGLISAIICFTTVRWPVGFSLIMMTLLTLFVGKSYTNHRLRRAYHRSTKKFADWVDRQNHAFRPLDCFWQVGKSKKKVTRLEFHLPVAQPSRVVDGDVVGNGIRADMIQVDVQGHPAFDNPLQRVNSVDSVHSSQSVQSFASVGQEGVRPGNIDINHREEIEEEVSSSKKKGKREYSYFGVEPDSERKLDPKKSP